MGGGRTALTRLACFRVAALLGTFGAGPARAEEVTLYAAASLTEAVREIGGRFAAATGHAVVYSFGGSNDLARQIAAGAPADLFFSADTARVAELQQAGLVRPEDRWDVLSNVLVVIVPEMAAPTLRSAADLGRVRRLALADPEAVPAGIYARHWLQTAGRWDAVKDRLVPLLDVRAALAAVEGGHVDAGIVYKTDAAMSRRVRVAFEVPRAEGPRITYVLARLARADRAAARALGQALRSPDALRVYQRHGFAVLGADGR
jgi:molybdate transport system substrate-binding protein